MMSIVHFEIINGYIKFDTCENDYARTLHKGKIRGFAITLVPGANFVNLHTGIRSFFQGARVWIPHSQVVWIGGELTEDLKEDGILEIELEDGNVSLLILDLLILDLYLSILTSELIKLTSFGIHVFFVALRRFGTLFVFFSTGDYRRCFQGCKKTAPFKKPRSFGWRK